ncbi:MAG TPA: pitrilysin family protein [Polyangiaceae bacterium]|nr:pitrilysin family protein [Polyangiaceae bacterium]
MMRRRLVFIALLATQLVACAAKPHTKAKAPAAKPVATAPAPDPEAWRGKRPNSTAPSAVNFPVSIERRLANGLTLLFVPRQAPITTLQLVVRGGAATVPAGKSGLAAIVARMLTEGTVKKSALELAIATESLGSSLSHDAERDAISLGMEVLPRDVPAALALLAEVVQTPAFRTADLQRVKAEWQDQLQSERQNPMRLASLAALRTLFGPELGAPVSGSALDVEKLTRNDLLTWHKAQVSPGNSALILVGDLDPELITQQAGELFGKWAAAKAAGTTRNAPVVPAAQKSRLILIDRPGSVQSAIFAAHSFPKRSEPGHEAREVVSSLFGGLFTSRLNMNLREQHAYTYGARSTVAAARNFGLFAISTSVERDVTAESIVQIFVELKALRDPNLKRPIAAEEIQRAKADLSHELGASLEHTGRVADRVATQFVQGLALDYHARYGATLAGLAPAQIEQAAQLINSDQLTLVVVGDRAAIEPKLAALQLPIEIASKQLTE